MKRRSSLLAVVVLLILFFIVVGIYKTSFRKDTEPFEKASTPTMNARETQRQESVAVQQGGQGLDTLPTAGDSPSGPPPVPEAPLTEADDSLKAASPDRADGKEAVKRLRRARNLYAADPTLSQDQKARILSLLREESEKKGIEFPEPTEEDLREQERIRQAMLELRESAEGIKEDPTLSRMEKHEGIGRLFQSFLDKMGQEAKE